MSNVYALNSEKNDRKTITPSQSTQKIGIIISMFPELHETFIVRELDALERAGVDFEIFSLQPPRDPVTIETAQRLMHQRTRYARLFGLLPLLALLRTILFHPVKFGKMIVKLTQAGRETPKELLKSYAILPITFHFGLIMKKLGIRHTHGHWANVPTTACWILSQVYDFTWSAAIHGEDIFSHNPLLETKLDESRFCVVCTGLFCNHLKEKMQHTHPEDIHLNYHGLDPKLLQRIKQCADAGSPKPAHADKKTIITIGRLVKTKGHHDLITAVRRLLDQGLPVHLNLIGSGPEEADLKQLVQQLNLGANVSFLGMMGFDEVMDQFQQSDLFALAPQMIPGRPPDGIPNVIAEAMAFGIPVVSTEVSAIPELIESGTQGLLVPPANPEALADAIAKVLQDPALAESLRDAGKTKVFRMFDQKTNIDELIELFERYVGPVRLPVSDTNHQPIDPNWAKPRVLFVIEALTVGGAERLVVDLANQFWQSGQWAVNVICLSKAGELADQLDAGVTLHLLNKKPGFDPQLFRHLPKLVREIRPSVINSHLWTANTWTRATLCHRIAPIIVTEHSRDFWKSTQHRLIDRCLSLFTAKLVAVSQDTSQFYRETVKIPDDQVEVINNGIVVETYQNGNGSQLRAALNLPEESLIVGTVGRLIPAKNHVRFVEAMATVVKAVPTAHAVIAGSGEELEKIQAAIAQYQLGDRVHLLGNRTDVPNLLAAFDLFVLSSDREGHPLSALEAQAAGCPVVLTEVGGNADAIAGQPGSSSPVSDTQGGMLVPANSSALANAITQLLQDEPKRLAMGEFAKDYAIEQFSLASMVKRYERLMKHEMSSLARLSLRRVLGLFR